MAIGASTYPVQVTKSVSPGTSPLVYSCLAAHPVHPSQYHTDKAKNEYSRRQHVVFDGKGSSERIATEKGRSARMPLTRRTAASTEKESWSGGKSATMSKASSSSAAASGSSGSRRAADRVREMEPSKQAIHERRNSAQSLRLDLEGLDLGHGIMSGGRIEMKKEERSGSSKKLATKKDSPSHGRAAFISHSPGTAPTVEDTAPRERPEDSFLAHLRDCAESNDDFEKNANPLFEFAAHKEAQGSNNTAQGNPGAVTAVPYKDDFDSDAPKGDEAEVVSPPEDTQSVWSTLVPILSDPSSTLDILSIEEMGLHSINVGSSEDWEGVTLSHPCEDCSEGAHAKDEASPDTQWSVAWSTKRQRKWIVTPSIPSASRTVVISDHVTARQDGDKVVSSSSEAPKSFSDDSLFSLRFLQAGTGAPNFTILLATPASHRRQVSKGQAGLEGAASSPADNLRTAAPASVLEEVTQGTFSKDSDEQWPAMRAMAARRDSRIGMSHRKSSSTINAAGAPMVNLNSRRPSLGKSVSHESLLHEATSPATIQTAGLASPSDEEGDATAEAPRAARHNESNGRESEDDYREMPGSAQQNIFAASTPFAQYSMASAKTPGEASMSPFSSTSPRSSQQVAREQISLAIPVPAKDSHKRGDLTRQAPPTPTFELDPLNSMPTPRWDGVGQVEVPSQAHKDASRKDRRLSGWIRKKVMYSSNAASPPPLPPAWQQQGRISPVGPFQVDTHPSLHARPSKANMKADKANSSSVGPAASDIPTTVGGGGSSGSGSDVAAVGGPVMTMKRSQGGESSASTAASSTTSPQSSLSSVPRQGSAAIEEMADATMPLSLAQTSQGDYVWPGVFSVRGERRRSNSDDNMALMIEAARRRHEVLSGSNPPLTPAITSTGAVAMPGRSHQPIQENRGANSVFSASLPPQAFSVLDSYNVLARRLAANQLTPTALLDLDNVPANALTMMIPLPMRMKGNSSSSNRGAARYLRVSFVPFTSAQEASTKEGGVEATGHPSVSSNWYKKIAHAWNANTGVIRSDSQGSSDEDSHHKHDDVRHNHQTYSSLEKDSSSSHLESFRIIAKVVGHPVRAPAARDLDALPDLFAFPVILGVCDRQRSISLISEGWQAIGLPSGPSDAGPLCGVADLIVAGCVACMDL